MALPINLKTPEYEIDLVTVKGVRYRPYLVREERILLQAAENKSPVEQAKQFLAVAQGCVLTEGLDISMLPVFDFGLLFLNIRGKSVGQTLKINLTCQNQECKHKQAITTNLDDIKIKQNPDHENTIKLKLNTDQGIQDMAVQMRYPTINETLLSDSETNEFQFMASCITKIYHGPSIYDNISIEDRMQFMDSLTQGQLSSIAKFFQTSPKLEHIIEYNCQKCGTKNSYVLDQLTDFFT